MRQELEKSLYDAKPIRRDLIVYQVGDLENLSASALYTGNLPKFSAGGAGFELPKPLGSISRFESKPIEISVPKVGMTLEGGLNIKKIGHNSLTLNTDYGLLRDLYNFHPDGSGSKREITLKKPTILIDKKSW